MVTAFISHVPLAAWHVALLNQQLKQHARHVAESLAGNLRVYDYQ